MRKGWCWSGRTVTSLGEAMACHRIPRQSSTGCAARLDQTSQYPAQTTTKETSMTTTSVKSDAGTAVIYEMIDNELERLEIIKEVPSQGVVSYSGNVPFFHVSLLDIPTPDQKDPAGDALLLADLEKMR